MNRTRYFDEACRVIGRSEDDFYYYWRRMKGVWERYAVVVNRKFESLLCDGNEKAAKRLMKEFIRSNLNAIKN